MPEMFDEAQRLHLAGRIDEAEVLYEKLLEQNPNNGGLCATIGTLFLQKNKMGLAIHFLRAAAENKDTAKQSDILSNLGLAYKYTGDMERAKFYFEKSIKHAPSAESLANYSALFVESGDPTKSERICRQAINMNSELPIAHWNLALTLLGEGKWDEAWDEHEWGFKVGGMRAHRAMGTIPEWDGTPGKRLHVYGEQGMGDEIMFASILPDLLRENDVLLECHERLTTLFSKSFPGMPVFGTREKTDKPDWYDGHTCEASVSLGSLGKYFRRSREAFPGTPYLHADPAPKGDKIRIGISWSGGGAKAGRVIKRSVPLNWWRPILNMPDVEIVSLQYTNCADEIRTVENLGGYTIRQFEEIKAHDYYETAKIVKSCDLVISVCTSVIHLAGALGVPCWIMTPKYPAWRYQNRGGMPWYKSVRLYRQPEASEDNPQDIRTWKPVIDRIAFDLEDWLGTRKEKVA